MTLGSLISEMSNSTEKEERKRREESEEFKESFESKLDRILVVGGTIVGGLGFLFFPVVLGPLTMLAGVLEAILYDIRRGAAVFVLGLGSLVIGTVIGILFAYFTGVF